MKPSHPTLNVFAFLLGAVFFLALASWSQPAQAQRMGPEDRIVDPLNFHSGMLHAQWLPYGRRWAIQGTTLDPANEIKAVIGELRDRNGRDVKRSCWVVPADHNTDVYRLIFEPLDIGRRYDLRMDFYGQFDVEQLKPALDQAYDNTVRAVSASNAPTFITAQTIQNNFLQSIEAELARLLQQDGVVFVQDLNNGDCDLVNEQQDLPPISLDDDLEQRIATNVLAARRAELRATELEEIRAQNRQLLNDNQFIGMLASLRDRSGAPYYFHDRQDVSQLQAAIADNTVPEMEVLDRFYASAQECRRDEDNFPTDQCTLLGEIIDRSQTLLIERDAEYPDFPSIKRELLEDLSENLSQVYLRKANSRLHVFQDGDYQTRSNRIRIGTAVSFGAAALNFTPTQNKAFDLEDVESFAMVSLKFYPFAIDKKLSKPYQGREFLARTSLVTGILLKRRLNFQGQNLEGVTGAIYPMFGVGFDITKNITLQGGTTFFRQPSVSVVDQSSEFKAAPVLSIGFDFDGVNWIRDRLRDMN